MSVCVIVMVSIVIILTLRTDLIVVQPAVIIAKYQIIIESHVFSEQ